MKITILTKRQQQKIQSEFPATVFLDETARVSLEGGALASLEFLEMVSGGAAPNLNGSEITPTDYGRSRFRVTTTTGEQADFNLCFCETALTDPARPFYYNPAKSLEHRDPLNVVGNLARFAGWFNGCADELIGRSLGEYGA